MLNTPRNEISFSRACKAAVNTPSQVYNCIEFTGFCKKMKKIASNIHWKDTGIDVFSKAAQWLYPNWKSELWNIWKSFPRNDAEEIIKELHSRKVLKNNIAGNKIFGININSSDFFRDTNISFSLYDKNLKKEIWIIGVYILPNKQVEIFQIQWRKKYWVDEEEFKFMLDEVKTFFEDLWFTRLLILRSAKNYLSTKPNHTKSFKSKKDETLWLEKHRTRMWMTYDGNPIRKWWFKKPESERDREFYSWELLLNS